MTDGSCDRRWQLSWALLVGALAIHVADEALTGFLPFYNAIVDGIRAEHPWVPLPTFTFAAWIGGLATVVAILFAMTPLLRRGASAMRFMAYFLGSLMVLNAVGHTAASVWIGAPAPGVYSAPVLLIAAIALLYTTHRSRPGAGAGRT